MVGPAVELTFLFVAGAQFFGGHQGFGPVGIGGQHLQRVQDTVIVRQTGRKSDNNHVHSAS